MIFPQIFLKGTSSSGGVRGAPAHCTPSWLRNLLAPLRLAAAACVCAQVVSIVTAGSTNGKGLFFPEGARSIPLPQVSALIVPENVHSGLRCDKRNIALSPGRLLLAAEAKELAAQTTEPVCIAQA